MCMGMCERALKGWLSGRAVLTAQERGLGLEGELGLEGGSSRVQAKHGQVRVRLEAPPAGCGSPLPSAGNSVQCPVMPPLRKMGAVFINYRRGSE